MSLRTWIKASAKALRPDPPPAQTVPDQPVTALAPSKPFQPAAAPHLPPHPDLALVMQHWRAHQRKFPSGSWPQFIRILENRHAFFREERVERQAKLAALQAQPRFTP
jgi:hypothetical protein